MLITLKVVFELQRVLAKSTRNATAFIVIRLESAKIHRETCGSVLKDIFGIKKEMVAYHKLKSLKDLVLPSKIQASKHAKLKASVYVSK